VSTQSEIGRTKVGKSHTDKQAEDRPQKDILPSSRALDIFSRVSTSVSVFNLNYRVSYALCETKTNIRHNIRGYHRDEC
jgi:hypothetical protein